MNTDASQGMLGVISNFTVNYNLETPDGVIEDELGVLPKSILINMDFTVLHETTLGWNENNTFMSRQYPYNIADAAFAPETSLPQPLVTRDRIFDGDVDYKLGDVKDPGDTHQGANEGGLGAVGQSDQSLEEAISPDLIEVDSVTRSPEAQEHHDNEVSKLDRRWDWSDTPRSRRKRRQANKWKP